MLHAEAFPAASDRSGFDVRQLAGLRITIARSASAEHLAIDDGRRRLRLDIVAGTLLDGPVRLRFLIDGPDGVDHQFTELLVERCSPVEVQGIDLSSAMLARLRAKAGAQDIPTVQGDFATTRLGRTFRLAYLVFNTIGNLTTQDEQVACFQNAADHLEPGGRFVIEVGVPQLQRLPPGETHRPFAVSPTHLGLDEYDLVEQSLVSHHYYLDGDRVRYEFTPLRYTWPAELDLMARLAGLRRRARYADWDRSPFTATSTKHVSVWETPAS